MKSHASRLAALVLLATSTILVSAWAGGGMANWALGGDSVGTLPATAGGNAVVVGQSTDQLDLSYGIEHRCANFFMTLPARGLDLVVQSAVGEGYVLVVPLGKELVRAEFHGDITVAMNEEMLSLFGAQMGLVSESTEQILVGVEVDSLTARPVRMTGGEASVIPIQSIMSTQGMGVQELVLQCFQAPELPTQMIFTRGAGLIVLTQSGYMPH